MIDFPTADWSGQVDILPLLREDISVINMIDVPTIQEIGLILILLVLRAQKTQCCCCLCDLCFHRRGETCRSFCLYCQCQGDREDNCCCLHDQCSHHGGDRSSIITVSAKSKEKTVVVYITNVLTVEKTDIASIVYFHCQEHREDKCTRFYEQYSNRGGDRSVVILLVPTTKKRYCCCLYDQCSHGESCCCC